MNNKHTFILLLMMIVFIVSISTVSSTDLNATDEIVDDSINDDVIIDEQDQQVLGISNDDNLGMNNDSDELGMVFTPKTFSELQANVADANVGDTIILNGYFSFDSPITVDKKLTFSGQNNAIVDGQSKTRFFNVKANEVIFKDITFQNGYSASYPGASAIWCNFVSYCQIIHCSFINNVANYDSYGGSECGGAVYFYGDYNKIINSTFINNNIYSEKGYGSAIHLIYGDDLEVTNCTFTKNNANYGGAIYIYEGDGLKIDNCTFNDNSAKKGGAIFISRSGSAISNCHFFNNNASEIGGAIDLETGVTVDNCDFVKNSAKEAGALYYNTRWGKSISNCNFIDNLALVRAGALLVYGSPVNDCNFTNNVALGRAGAIYDASNRNRIGTCNFNNNRDYLGYSEIVYPSTLSNIDDVSTIFGDKIIFNITLSTNFGPLANKNLKFLIDDDEYSTTTDSNGFVSYDLTEYLSEIKKYSVSVVFEGDYSYEAVSKKVEVNIIESKDRVYETFSNIKTAIDCADDGATITLVGSFYNDIQSQISINKNLNFVGINLATLDAGGLSRIFNIGNVNVTFKQIIFQNGVSDGGSAIHSAGYCVFTECSFLNNSVEISRGANGGAIHSTNYCEFKYCTFLDNWAKGSWGASGGAVYSSGTSSFSGCKFTDNSAIASWNGYGGAVYSSGTSSFSGCKFTNNSATATWTPNGGAIYTDGYCSITGCDFKNNKVSGSRHDSYGGAVYIIGAIESDKCTFVGNSAQVAGAISNSLLQINDTYALLGEDSILTAKLSGADKLSNRKIIFNINGTAYDSTTDDDGIATLNIRDIYKDIGTFTVTVSFSGDEFFSSVSKECNVILKYRSVLSTISSYNGGEGVIMINLSNVKGPLSNENIILNIENENYNLITNENGVVFFNIKDYYHDLKQYTITVNYTGDDNNSPSSDILITSLTKYDSVINADSISFVHNDDGIMFINLTNVNGPIDSGMIDFIINGVVVSSKPTTSEGLASLNVNNYIKEIGEHTLNVSFRGNNLNNPSSINVSVHIVTYEGYLTVSSNGKYYNDTSLSFNLVNIKNNNGVFNASIFVTFSNGENITLKTDSSGAADYIVPFAPNTYTYAAKIIDNDVKVNEVGGNVVINEIVGVIDVSQEGYEFNNSRVVVRLYNSDTGDFYRKIKVSIEFNTKGETFDVITDDSGIGILDPVPFGIGEYPILVSVSGEHTSFDNVISEVRITDKAESIVTCEDIVFNYGESGSTVLNVIGGEINENSITVIGHNEASVNFENNVITVSGLVAGQYTLSLVTNPDSNHKSITKKIPITVNTVPSRVSGNDIVFDYGGSGSTTLSLDGCTLTVDNIEVVGHGEADISFEEMRVTVSKLNVGSYVLRLTTTPDTNHKSVTKDIGITVNPVDSSINFNDIIFDYNGSGSTTLILTGCSVTLNNIKVIGHDEAIISLDGNIITVSNLDVGSYTLQVTTTPDINHKSVNKTALITVNKINSDVSFKNQVIFNYKDSGYTILTVIGGNVLLSNIKVINHDEANIDLNGDRVTVSNLNAGNYTLQVTTTPDNNHKSVVKTVNITVNKIDADVTFTNTIAFNAGSSGSTTITVIGGTTDLSHISVVGHDEAVIRYVGGVVSVSGLTVGTYSLIVTVNPDHNHNSVTRSIGISVTGSGSGSIIKSEVTFSTNNIVFNYGGEGYTTLALVGCNVTQNHVYVNGHPDAAKLEGNRITVSGLNPGSYTLYVVTTPHEGYYSVTATLPITVNRIDSSIAFDNNMISFDYGSTGSVGVDVIGGSVGTMTVLNHNEAKISITNNIIRVSGLNAGSYTLIVTSSPDNYHNTVSKTIGITVNKVNSTLSFSKDEMKFEYGSLGSINVRVTGGSISIGGISVIEYEDAKISLGGNIISVSNLPIGNYTLKVTTTPDSNHNQISKNINVTVTKAQSSIGYTNDVVFDYLGSGSTTLILDGCSVLISDINVVDYPDASISIDRNNKITISGLDDGEYMLEITSTPDNNHESSVAYIPITVNTIDSNIGFTSDRISFKYAESGSVSVVLTGCSDFAELNVDGHPEADIDFDGVKITVSGLNVGTYTLRVTSNPDEHYDTVERTIPVTVIKNNAVIKVSKITVAYKKSTSWSITLRDSSGNPIANQYVTLKIFTGKKYVTIKVRTNSEGVATYNTKSLAVGNHKVILSLSHAGYNNNPVTSYINVIKQTKLTFKVKKKTSKDGATLSISVYSNKKPINGIKIKLLVYTGKTYKTISLKTKTKSGYKGVCGYATNTLSVGTHKVVIQPVNLKYSGSAKSAMTIKSSAKKYPNWTTKI